MTLDEQIAFFFAPPIPRQPGPMVSPLHLMRREAQDCYLGEVVPEDAALSDGRQQRLFATTMVLWSGIDLLAQFYVGPGVRVKKRITTFCKAFVLVTGADPTKATECADVLYYGCRNPLMHSFTLHDDKNDKKYTVGLVSDLGPSLVRWGPYRETTLYLISVRGLFKGFIGAIGAYEHALRASPDLQEKFRAVFPTLGSIRVGETPQDSALGRLLRASDWRT